MARRGAVTRAVAAIRRVARRDANRLAQQRWRRRVKNCEASYNVDAGTAVLNMLVRRHYLEDEETDDDLEVGKAISLFMRDHAKLDEP